MSDDVVFEYADGSGAWLIYSAGADELCAAIIRKECRREHARRMREGLPCNGVIRLRRAGEAVRNEIVSGAAA